MSSAPDDFEIIHHEVCSIHETWNLVLDLFKEDHDVEVLDQTGATAWMLIYNALLDSILLGLTRRVDDDPKTMQLQRIVSSTPVTELQQKLNSQLTRFKEKAKPLIKHRHGRVAHSNHKVARGDAMLPPISFSDFDELLGDLRELMNTVYQTREHAYFGYEYTRRIGGGKEVLECLRNGLRLSDVRDAAWEGLRTPEELFDNLRKYPDVG